MAEKIKEGDRVRHKRVPSALGTVTKVNTERRPTRDGRILDLYVQWDDRGGVGPFGSMFSEIEKA